MPSTWPGPWGRATPSRSPRIVSGLPLLNFPVARRRLMSRRAAQRLTPGAPLIQFSYGMHAPVAPPPEAIA